MPKSPAPPRRRDWVVKSNDLVNARYDWTVLQQRMILLMIAQLDIDGDDFGNQRIEVAEIVERSGLSSNAYYERAAEAAAALLDQKIFVRTDAGRWRGYNLLSFVEPHPGHIVARFNPDMRPFLLQLKRRFTRYMLAHVLRFQSPYSVRIYEMAVQFADLGCRTVPLDDLREVLGLADKYPRFYDFKRRVLDQAVKEIARYTDSVVTYDLVRDGRTPTHVRLFVRSKAEGELPAPPPKGRKRKKADPSQQALDFVLPSRPAPTGAPGADAPADPDAAAFRAWWDARDDDERAELEAAAGDRLDPFVQEFRRGSPHSLAVQTAVAAELRVLWRERTAGVALDEDAARR